MWGPRGRKREAFNFQAVPREEKGSSPARGKKGSSSGPACRRPKEEVYLTGEKGKRKGKILTRRSRGDPKEAGREGKGFLSSAIFKRNEKKEEKGAQATSNAQGPRKRKPKTISQEGRKKDNNTFSSSPREIVVKKGDFFHWENILYLT